MKIINCGTYTINRFMLALPEGYVLIDTGYKWEYPAFCKALEKNGIKKEEIKYVIITHAHADHAGFLKEMLEEISPVVIYNPLQKPRLEAGKNNCEVFVPGLMIQITSKISAAMVDKMQCYPSLNTENFVSYEENPLAEFGIEFIPLNGHTEGDLAVKVGSDLFCGDVCMSSLKSTHHFPLWLEDKFALLRSWETILEQKEVATIYPGHGKPFDIKLLVKDLEYWRDKGVMPLNSRNKNQLKV